MQGGFPAKLPYHRQIERLEQTFQKTSEDLAKAAQGVDIAVDPRAVVPERALVFELLGPVTGFEVAIQALGFEWMGGQGKTPVDDPDDLDDSAPQAQVMYMTMPTRESLRKLLSQWEEFKRLRGESAPRGLAPLWNMFSYLRDLRTWSVQDRLDPAITRYVDALLAADPNREVLIEFSFWYRADQIRRGQALSTLDRLLQETGGTRVDFVEIREIGYQGALVKLPAHVARQLANSEGGLAGLDDVMSIRPQSSYDALSESATPTELRDLREIPDVTGPCIAAILDGYPVASHEALQGRVHVHEVDVSGGDAPVASRYHGTAMASLVLHGDMHLPQEQLSRKVCLVPVLTGNPQNGQESTPKEKLAIGVIHRALQAIINADPEQHPHLANVAIISHSLGDAFAPFARRPSPWATLLDYYSHQYNLLFVVSAGNIESPVPLTQFNNLAAFEAADPIVRQAAIMTSVEAAKGHRGLLSPAEQINGITVGAEHADHAPNGFGALIDPYPQHRMPNLASAIGFGVNRSIKPDMLHAGGRFSAAGSNIPTGGVHVSAKKAVGVGQLVAAPSPIGDLRNTAQTAGTSNAAALVTRAGVQLADPLDVAYEGESVPWIERKTRAVILKAMLAHGCRWGDIGDTLEGAYPPLEADQWQARRDTISKFLGYGAIDISRVVNGEDNRITLLADDLIEPEKLHEYRLPIPTAMLQNNEIRSLTLTLAWTTPVVPTTIDYRGVALKIVSKSGKMDIWEGVTREGPTQPNGKTSERGTLIHMKLSGNKIMRVAQAGGIFVGVQGRARHHTLKKEVVPYALAVTMEVAQSVKTQGLYEQVRQEIAARTAVRGTVRAGRA